MDMRTFERLRPSFPAADLVYLQGWGEPLLHPRFWEMVGHAKAAGAMTGFTTNGTLLNHANTLQLVESGTDIVAISLAGSVPGTHERFRPDCGFTQIDEALGVLKALKLERGALKPRVHIAFLLLRSNSQEINGLVDLAVRWGATQVVVGNLTWIGTEALQEEAISTNYHLWPEVTTALERARRQASDRGIEFSYHDPGTKQPRPTCTENVLDACFVSYRGDVSPCVFTNLSGLSGGQAVRYFEGRGYKAPSVVFGNVHDEMLPAIWNSAGARAFRESFRSGWRRTAPEPISCRRRADTATNSSSACGIDEYCIYRCLDGILFGGEGFQIDACSGRLNLPRRVCRRHDRDYPCTCAMGNLYRFVEPVVLLLLKEKGRSYGYDLSAELSRHALTDAEIERAALYRTLRQLEKNGNVVSRWDTEQGGPARRVYKLTAQGERHLEEWATVLDHVSRSMGRFVKEVRGLKSAKSAPEAKTA